VPTLTELEAQARAAATPQVSMRPPPPVAQTGWTPQAVGSFILAPVLAALTAWAMRSPAPPPDAPTRAELVELKAELASARSDASAARLDCAVARESASVARSRAGAAEAVADSAVKR
jgi:hypothetical protein